MDLLGKHIIKGVVSVMFLALTWAVSSLWNDTKTNTRYSFEHKKEIESISERVKNIEKRQDGMNDVYVTRRELTIMLNSLKSKVDSVNSEVKNINNKFDKMIEKMYEKK